MGSVDLAAARDGGSLTPHTPARVLHLVDSLETGGTEIVAVDLVNRLPAERWRRYLGTTRCDGPLARQVAPEVERLRLGRRRRFSPAAVWRLREFIRRHEIDLVHAHSTSLFVAAAAHRLWPRFALVWHDHFGRFETEARPVWLYRPFVRACGAVVSVTEALADWSRDSLGVPPAKIYFLPNSPPRLVDPGLAGELPGLAGRRIVCVGNLRPQKGHLHLVAAMAEVVRSEPDAHLIVVGGGAGARYETQLRREVSGRGLDRQVSFLGSRADVPAILRACDIGVLASTSEGLPLSLLEYGAAGLGVVVTDVGECRQVVGGGEAGVVVPAGDPAQLAQAVTSLLREPEKRRQLGRRLAERVERVYSSGAMVARLEEIYRSLLPLERLL